MSSIDVLSPTRRHIIGPHGHAYGHNPDRPDQRDLIWLPDKTTVPTPPPTLRLDESPAGGFDPYDQGQLGSCTANGIGGAIEFDLRAQGLTDFVPSRLWIYFWERYVEGTVAQDAGGQIRDGIKVVAKVGVPNESLWPYDITKFTVQPPTSLDADAAKTLAVLYKRVPVSASGFCRVLASTHRPIVFGTSVFESFEQDTGSDGIAPMPAGQLLGGHCMLIVGYALIGGKLYFRVRNSWGKTWGDGGYCWLPAAWVASSQFTSDCWSVTSVS